MLNFKCHRCNRLTTMINSKGSLVSNIKHCKLLGLQATRLHLVSPKSHQEVKSSVLFHWPLSTLPTGKTQTSLGFTAWVCQPGEHRTRCQGQGAPAPSPARLFLPLPEKLQNRENVRKFQFGTREINYSVLIFPDVQSSPE